MNLRHIHPNDLDDHWEKVKAGLARVISKGSGSWKPEHVYLALATGKAFLTVDDDDGILIWQRLPGDDGRGMLFVWACAGNGMHDKREAVYEGIEEMMRDAKCKVARMISSRKGWMRDPFWELTGYVYEHEVKNGR